MIDTKDNEKDMSFALLKDDPWIHQYLELRKGGLLPNSSVHPTQDLSFIMSFLDWKEEAMMAPVQSSGIVAKFKRLFGR